MSNEESTILKNILSIFYGLVQIEFHPFVCLITFRLV